MHGLRFSPALLAAGIHALLSARLSGGPRVLLGQHVNVTAWILGSSPRMTKGKALPPVDAGEGAARLRYAAFFRASRALMLSTSARGVAAKSILV
jgi:hypothetical protein